MWARSNEGTSETYNRSERCHCKQSTKFSHSQIHKFTYRNRKYICLLSELFIGYRIIYQPITVSVSLWTVCGSLPSTRCHAGLRKDVCLVQLPKPPDSGAAVDLYLCLPALHRPFFAGPQQNRVDGYILEVCKNRGEEESVGGSLLRGHGSQHPLLVLNTPLPSDTVYKQTERVCNAVREVRLKFFGRSFIVSVCF